MLEADCTQWLCCISSDGIAYCVIAYLEDFISSRRAFVTSWAQPACMTHVKTLLTYGDCKFVIVVTKSRTCAVAATRVHWVRSYAA